MKYAKDFMPESKKTQNRQILGVQLEFGKLSDISHVNWALPLDDPKNQAWLNNRQIQNKISIGSPAWGVNHWIGKIYPRGCKSKDFLYHYSRFFNCIELNSTHYIFPSSQNISRWKEKTPSNFQFCPKVHKDISHSKSGLLDRSLNLAWIHAISAFEDQLGPCFIQFHESFSYLEKGLLFKFLRNWPSEIKLSVELRHSSWFDKNSIIPALGDYLASRNIGLVITDVAGRRDLIHSSLPTPWPLIRLIGNNLDPSDQRRLQDWSTKFQSWFRNGVEHIYLLLHQPEDHFTLDFTQLAASSLGQANFTNISEFKLMEQMQTVSLF